MAVKPPRERAFRPALSLGAGGLRLALLRVALRVTFGLPALLVALHLAGKIASRPYFTDAARPLSAHLAAAIIGKLGALLPAMLGAAVLWVLLEQVMLAGVLSWLDPLRHAGTATTRPRRVAATVLREGLGHLWPLLRLLVLAALVGFALRRTVTPLFDMLAEHGDRAGWTGLTLLLRLPLLEAGTLLLGAALLSSWAFAARVAIVADGRRVARRSATVALGLWRRYPVRWLVFGLVRVALPIGGALLLVTWRQISPRDGATLVALLAAWVGYLLLEAYLWVWLLKAGRLLYATRAAAPLRDVPDGPWRWLGSLRDAVLRRRSTPDAAPPTGR